MLNFLRELVCIFMRDTHLYLYSFVLSLSAFGIKLVLAS